MNFTPIPPPIEEPDDHSGVMHIEGPTSSRVRWIIRWILLIAIVAGVMIGLFMKFGATVAWAFCLVVSCLGTCSSWGAGPAITIVFRPSEEATNGTNEHESEREKDELNFLW